MYETGGVRSGRRELPWIDALKGLALLWIFANHLSEHLLGGPYLANPYANWPPLAERIAQLRPIGGHGLLDLPWNLFRYVGWAGDQGVQIFLVLSGFGLTWAASSRGAPLPPLEFYRRRLARLLPLWWGAHIAFVPLAIFFGWTSPGQLSNVLSLLGVRLTPNQLYALVPAWWFIGLLLQLYLVFPWLLRALARLGPGRFLAVAFALALPARAVGLLYFEEYLDAWSRGAIFVTRLPEFAVGMALARWMHTDPEGTRHTLRRTRTLTLALLAYLIGTLASATVAGMTVAPLLLGLGAFALLLRFVRGLEPKAPAAFRALRWLGLHSYALFLTHHPWIVHVVPHSGMRGVLVGTLLAVSGTVASALLLERAVARATRSFTAARRERRLPGWFLRLGLCGVAVLCLVVGADQVVRRLDPRENVHTGWGERPALRPDDALGWTLIPSSTTRLRWESYDYVVRANSLGFPGPEVATTRPPGRLRVLTVGDAFTSAEGVDTEEAWPRLLETRLRDRSIDAEVQNFAVTGYGPNQYLAVLRRFVPELRPQVVLVGLFVNDFEDVLVSDREFRRSIGFESRPPDSFVERWRPAHLARWLTVEVFEPLGELLLGVPRPYGVLLGHYDVFERSGAARFARGRELVRARLAAMQVVCRDAGAALVLVLVPSRAQAGDPAALDYTPRSLALADDERFDADRPQRAADELATELQLPCVDLRDVLAAPTATYWQRRNMHWTAAGHAVVAERVAEYLIAAGYARE